MASANNLGTAYIRIAPQMQGIQSSIQSKLSGLGSTVGAEFSNGFTAKWGAAAGAIAGITHTAVTKAIDALTKSIDGAITRVDTLNVFPKIMKNLGFEAEESTESLDKLSTRIEGLPTTLDEIVSYTQRLASTMGNLNKGTLNATNLALAFNDAALAGGKGQYEANRAFEQFVQVMSRGRPTMQDWKIMLEVMPGQLKQLAKYMGTNNKSLADYAKSAKKTVDQLDGMDLYEWISEGKNANAKERLAELAEAMVNLDTEGGAGVTAFKDQVGDATHTIGTAMRLIPVRITKAMAQVIQAFGAGDIYETIDKFTQSFKGIGEWVVQYVVPPLKNEVIPFLARLLKNIKNIATAILGSEAGRKALVKLLEAFIAFKAIKAVGSTVVAFTKNVSGLFKVISGAVGGVSTFSKFLKASGDLNTAFMNTAASTTGAVSGVAKFGAAITDTTPAVAGLMTKLGALSIGIGAAIVAVGTFAMAMVDHNTKVESARIRLENYQKTLVNTTNAQRQLTKAEQLEQGILTDLELKRKLQNDTEYQALVAKQNLANLQDEYNQMLKEGGHSADELRMKQLEVMAAESALKDATKAHEEAMEDVARVQSQYADNLLTALHRSNQLTNAETLKNKEYATLATTLDNLKNETIEYYDENGNLLKKSKEEMVNISNWYAEELTKNDKTWKAIVSLAEKEGISFVEATERVGAMAGGKLAGNFTTALENAKPLALRATQDMADSIKGVFNGINLASVGTDIVNGLINGMNSMAPKVQTVSKSIADRVSTIAKELKIHSPSRVMFDVGQNVDLGLIKGMESLSDRVEQTAEGIASSIQTPFDSQGQLDATANISRSASPLASQFTPSTQPQVVQNNTFNQVADDLDVKEASKLLGFEVATAI